MSSKPTSPAETGGSEQLAKALGILHRWESRPYYDPSEDNTAINDYYEGIAEDASLVGEALFRVLSQKLSETHHNRLSYREARLEHLYPWIDLREDGKLVSIYSKDGMDPERVIRNEVQREKRIERTMRQRHAIESLSDEEYYQIAEELESSGGFNCEHVVCQSWFNKRQPMKADLHHLFSCEPRCNSFRNNFPYFEFGPEDEAVMQNCGRNERATAGEAAKFEPRAGKGEVARATLYFLIRYPGEIGDAFRELQLERLGVILDWHHKYPVTRYEQHRNAEIYKVQGNRNPLIDFPEWADSIAFESGFGS